MGKYLGAAVLLKGLFHLRAMTLLRTSSVLHEHHISSHFADLHVAYMRSPLKDFCKEITALFSR